MHAQKNKGIVKRASAQADYVAQKMNLDDSQKAFLLESLTEKMERTSAKVKGKSLTDEAKKKIYNESNALFVKKLSAKFMDNEIKQIRSLIREYQKQRNK